MKELRFEDPRSPLERLRRSHLRRYLRFHGIPCDPDAPATTMRALAIDRGLNGTDWPEVEQNTAPKLVVVPEASDLPDTIQELRKLCKARNIPQSPSDNVAALKAKLNENAS